MNKDIIVIIRRLSISSEELKVTTIEKICEHQNTKQVVRDCNSCKVVKKVKIEE